MKVYVFTTHDGVCEVFSNKDEAIKFAAYNITEYFSKKSWIDVDIESTIKEVVEKGYTSFVYEEEVCDHEKAYHYSHEYWYSLTEHTVG